MSKESQEYTARLSAALSEPVNLLRAAFSDMEKPTARSGCECPFCIPREDLQLALQAGVGAAPPDLTLPYVANLFGTIDGSHEFPYLLPSLLETWAKELFQESSAYVQRLHHALFRGYSQAKSV